MGRLNFPNVTQNCAAIAYSTLGFFRFVNDPVFLQCETKHESNTVITCRLNIEKHNQLKKGGKKSYWIVKQYLHLDPWAMDMPSGRQNDEDQTPKSKILHIKVSYDLPSEWDGEGWHSLVYMKCHLFRIMKQTRLAPFHTANLLSRRQQCVVQVMQWWFLLYDADEENRVPG